MHARRFSAASPNAVRFLSWVWVWSLPSIPLAEASNKILANTWCSDVMQTLVAWSQRVGGPVGQPRASTTRRRSWVVTHAGKAACARKKRMPGLPALLLCIHGCTACSACTPGAAECATQKCILWLSFAVLATCSLVEYSVAVAVVSKTCAGVSPSARRSTLLVLLCGLALSGRRPKQFSQARHVV